VALPFLVVSQYQTECCSAVSVEGPLAGISLTSSSHALFCVHGANTQNIIITETFNPFRMGAGMQSGVCQPRSRISLVCPVLYTKKTYVFHIYIAFSIIKRQRKVSNVRLLKVKKVKLSHYRPELAWMVERYSSTLS
jgi:hypothetical protein